MKMMSSPFRAALAALSVLAVVLPTMLSAQDVNRIVSIKTTTTITTGEPTIAITLNSSREFPVRALPLVLQIGGKQFRLSLPAEDGSLNTVIFTLTLEEFAQTSTGDGVSVQYGEGDGSDKRSFGTLDKGLLDK